MYLGRSLVHENVSEVEEPERRVEQVLPQLYLPDLDMDITGIETLTPTPSIPKPKINLRNRPRLRNPQRSRTNRNSIEEEENVSEVEEPERRVEQVLPQLYLPDLDMDITPASPNPKSISETDPDSETPNGAEPTETALPTSTHRGGRECFGGRRA
jgi:hypothetical protein